MSNNLGSMVLELSANYAKFQSDMGKVIQSATDAADKITQSFAQVGELIGVAISVDAFKNIVTGATEAAEKIDHLSQSLGVSTATIQTLSFAAAKVGGDMETATASFAKLERAAEQAAAGTAQQVEAFRSIGISASQVTELLKSPDELIQTVAQHLAQFGDGAGKTAVVMQLFGRNAQQMIPLLNELGAGFEELAKEAQSLGVLLSGAQLKALQDVQSQFNLLGQQAKGLGNDLALSLAPAIQILVKDFADFLNSQGLKTALTDIGAAAKLLAENINLITIAIEALIAKSVAIWFLGVAEAIAKATVAARIGTAVWAEMTGAVAVTELAMVGLTAAGEGLLALVGGIPGLIGLASFGIYELATAQDAATKATNSLKEAQDLLNHTNADSVVADLAVAAAAEKKAAAEIADTQALIANLEAQQQANASVHLGATAADGAALAYLQTAGKLDALRDHLAQAQAALAALNKTTQDGAVDSRTFADTVSTVAKSFVSGDVAGNMQKFVTASNAIHAAASQARADGQNASVVNALEDASIQKLADSMDRASKAQVVYNAHVSAGHDVIGEFAKQEVALSQQLTALSGGLTGEYANAWKTYSESFDKVEFFLNTAKTLYDTNKISLTEYNADVAIGRDLQAELAQRFNDTNDKISAQADLLGKFVRNIDEETALLGLNDKELAVAEAVKKVTDEYNRNVEAGKPVLQSLQDLQNGAASAAGKFFDLQQAASLNTEAAKQWQSIWATAGNGVADTFAKVLVEGGSLFNSLKDLAKQTVEAIIAYFAKLAVINPILNSIFGGSIGFSLLPSLANAAGGSAGASILGANGSAGGNFFDASSWIGAGKNLFSGFSSLWSGQAGVSGASSNLFGTTVNNSGAYTYTPSLLGNAITIGGGILAGYNEIKAGGGILGGAAYGIGTITAGGAIAGIASGAGAAAGAAGALGTVGLGAIPVIGWAALIAMVVDKISGGKLFGTSANQFVGGNQTQTITDSGALVDTTGTFKGQHALFGGAYYKTKDIATDPAVQAAADAFFTQLKASTDAFAAQFAVKAVNVVGGAFTTTFDKNGKATGTSDTVLGVTRTGETQQQFAERLQADSYLAVLDKMGLGASDFVKGLQDDADKLFAAVQDFASATQAANIDLGNGFHFLALQSNATLADVMKFVESAAQAGETLTQTYTRLAQAQAQYNQFVQQFKPGTQYVDDFEAAFSQVYHQMLANIDAANKLAIAAGASGAAQEDLTNIQNAAAQQIAALVVQLEASAQSLAFSLGLTTQGTLDQTNQAIQDIISSAKNTTDATTTVATGLTTTAGAMAGFGSAITAVSKAATDAINLLLGNLSPLNDQQKLQIALQGLAQGTVTKEQVLQIGQALYASSEAYVNLFNQVSQYPDKSAGASSGGRRGGGGGKSSSSSAAAGAPPPDWTDSASQWAAAGLTLGQWNSLSDDNKAKLEDLLNKQTTLTAAKTAQDFNTLGQQIAEIATAKGEDFQTVIDEMGINNKDLEKGLGLKSDAELQAYLKKVQDQQDSAKENTQSIVDAINSLPDKLAIALNGRGAAPGITPTRAGPVPAPAAPPSAGDGSTAPPPGRGVAPPPGSGRYLTTDDIVNGVVAGVSRTVAPLVAQARNSSRPVVQVR